MEIYRTALKYNQNFEALVKIGDCYEKKQMYS